MVGEKFEICISEMAKNALKLSTMVGEIFEICISEMSRIALKTFFIIEVFKIDTSNWYKCNHHLHPKLVLTP